MSASSTGTTTTIPILPSRSIDEQLDFYQALGFEVTYRQAKPNLYACVSHPIVELHFFVLKSLQPENSYSMCYLHVPDVDAVYKEFSEKLKQAYNKVPTKGFPRISKPNDLTEDRRFHVIDPSGNRLLIGTKHAADRSIVEEKSKFATAFEAAYRLTYSKDAPEDAAKVLDAALRKQGPSSSELLFRAYVLRADIALSMEELDVAGEYLQKADQLLTSEKALLNKLGDECDKIEEMRARLEGED